jgi:cell division transport system permease protein
MKSLSSALTNIRRSPYQSLTAILMLSITFFVAYTFSLFILGTEQILRYFETRPQIIAFFELDASPSQLEAAQQTMEQKTYVEEVDLVTKDQALSIYQETNREDPLLLELVTADILPASIEVSGVDVESLTLIQEDLNQITGIDEVVYQKDVIDELTTWTNSVRWIGIIGLIVLSVTSLLTIMIITGMKSANRRGAINIMRIIGASRWYVQSPFVYEGVLYGVFGSTIGWSIMFIALLYLTPWLTNFLGNVPLLPVPMEVLLIQLAGGTGLGILFGGLASSIAVRRVMRK